MPGSAPTPHAHETRDSAANPPGPASASAAAEAVPDPPPRRSASAGATVPVADPHNPGDAPAGQDAEMSDEEYVPSSDEDSVASSMDTVPASGARNDEVVLAVSSSSTSDSPRHRRECRRRTVSSTVTPVLYDMDTSAEEVPGHKKFKTFRGVWEDRVSWEEVRSRKSRYRLVLTPREPSSTHALFPSQSFSASSSTPVPPASSVRSTFSSNGSVVDSVQTPILLSINVLRLRTIGSRAPSRCLSFCSVLAWLLGESDRCVGLPESPLLLQCCVFPRDVLYWSTSWVALFVFLWFPRAWCP